MQRKKYFINLFDHLPEETKAKVDVFRSMYELEANKKRTALNASILQRVLNKDQIAEFEQWYNDVYIKVFGQDELKAAQLYLNGELPAKDLLKKLKISKPKSEEKTIDLADQISGRLIRTVKPSV